MDKTLKISGWENTDHRDENILGLMRVCYSFRVRHLHFMNKAIGDSDNLFKCLRLVVNPTYPFLHHLHTIDVEDNRCPPAVEIASIARRSRVVKITWKLLWTQSAQYAEYCGSILRKLKESNVFSIVSNLREFVFLVPSYASKGSFVPFIPNCADWDIPSEQLKRNRLVFERCQKAIIVLIGLRKQRIDKTFSCLNHDMMRMILNMVWETRGTKVWIK